MLATAAQYNRPPRYAVKEICDAIDGAPSGSNVLSKISAGVFAYYQGRNNYTCFVNRLSQPSETDIGWGWQVLYINQLLNWSLNKLIVLNPSYTLIVFVFGIITCTIHIEM